MENPSYTTLARQTGLRNELRVIANNIANSATTGYRQEGLMFSEYVRDLGDGESLSMAAARVQLTSSQQGALSETGGSFDLAIEGEGFFLVETPNGPRLTRAGAFSPNAQGDLVTMDGYRVLDAGAAPLFVPPASTDVQIASDGTISTQGRAIGQIAIVQPTEQMRTEREDGVFFRADDGWDPVVEPRVLQGYLEQSNVDVLGQMARMIEVQRGYELGQSFLESEHERVRTALKSLTK
ncbi:flagellar hook-basal body complex protein [Pseudoprimorskyibacter insulae]|uniref:Flagellar basal-body rod protein FlgF n=1 Tax=Pseudoprimorskyibacter insulae TaxID=1695997 RepID=A0A2R8AYT8_9RHOB|nr:flagellar hook-basal body complex protein [Pseudoprimorskyibacter insulae]SPF81215.1 Flagellar basal-body rod protein FlgG [Pseudoprimorskyibacter insulae]